MTEENTVPVTVTIPEATESFVIKAPVATKAPVASYVNPFDEGVSYADFKEALGKKTVADYCKGKLNEDQISWLENELSILKND